MKTKAIIVVAFFFIFGLPTILGIANWSAKATANPSQENLEEGVQLAVEAAKPWYFDLVIGLAGFGMLGAFLIFGVLYISNRFGLQ